MSLDPILDGRDVVVCVGTGGVGKTTTSAAIALGAARRGRRAVVVTIDPARRLAETLGVGELDNTPRPATDAVTGLAAGTGELWAAMLDPKATFDDLVARHAADRDQADRILANPLYGTISTSLGGVQEYMAMEKLHELHTDPRFDLVVVDTPPAAHVLGLLDSPRLLGRLFDSWLYRALVPTRRSTRVAAGVVQGMIRPLTRLVGAAVIDQAVDFFRAFEGMEDGFRTRSAATLEVLQGPRTAFVLVTAPRFDALAQAEALAGELRQAGVGLSALAVNLVQPAYGGDTPPEDLLERCTGTPWEPHARALLDAARRREAELDAVAEAAARIGVGVVTTVPDLGDEVGVGQVAETLLP